MIPISWKSDTLTFRYMRSEDLPDVVTMLAKESVCRHVFFGPNTEKVTRQYFEPLINAIGKALAHGKPPEVSVFSIRENRTDRFVGNCALLPIDFSEGNYLIGYQFDAPFWHKGYGTEACQFLIQHAFLERDAYRLTGDCMADNTGSARIMEKCGFQSEGCQRKYYHVKGKMVDNRLFGLLREDLAPSTLEAYHTRFVQEETFLF